MQRQVQSPSEQNPLLGSRSPPNDETDGAPLVVEGKISTIIWTVLAGVFVVGLILVFALPVPDWSDPFPNPESILKSTPVIDGHIGQFNVFYARRVGSSRYTIRFTRTGQEVLCEQRICVQP